MQNFDTRLDSFRKWPHARRRNFIPKGPELAKAGFYFDPSDDSFDNVTCYLCGKSLEGWEESDVPFDVHSEKSAGCPLVNLHVGKARVETLLHANSFPRLQSATLDALAAAGFFYNGQRRSDVDVVSCFQCGITLEGWQEGDDAAKEHRKRNPLCHFLASGTCDFGSCYFLKYFSGLSVEVPTRRPAEPLSVDVESKQLEMEIARNQREIERRLEQSTAPQREEQPAEEREQFVDAVSESRPPPEKAAGGPIGTVR